LKSPQNPFAVPGLHYHSIQEKKENNKEEETDGRTRMLHAISFDMFNLAKNQSLRFGKHVEHLCAQWNLRLAELQQNQV
jgi:hypothetical protein